MKILKRIEEVAFRDHLDIGIMEDGKLNLCISNWSPNGLKRINAWLDREQVLELLDGIDMWAQITRK